MKRIALLSLVVLACFSAANAQANEETGEFWTDGKLRPSQQQAGATVAAAAAVPAAAAPAKQAASSSNSATPAPKNAPARNPSSQATAGARPVAPIKPATATPRRAASARPRPAPATAGAKQPQTPAARNTPAQRTNQPAAGRPTASAPIAQQQQQQQQLPPLFPPTVIRPPLGGGGEPMTRFSKDIRGLQLSIINIQLNPKTMSPDGSSITGFTFAGDLQCMAAANMPIVGTCYISADMLGEDGQAIATAICVTNTNAPNCDPQLTGSLTITATGLLTVNTGTINNNSNNSSSSSTGAVKAAASTAVISSFNTVTPMIVDGVYSSTRPDTLLSSIVGFKRGSLDVPNVKRTDSGSYTGSMTLSLFKGPVL